MNPTLCRHRDPPEDEDPSTEYGIRGASKETGIDGSIVTSTIEQTYQQRNPQQHPQVAGDLGVVQATTTSSTSSWRFRRTCFDARTSVIDIDMAKAAAPADPAANAGSSPRLTTSSYECAKEIFQYLAPSATCSHQERADVVNEPYYGAPVPESMVRPHSGTSVERCASSGG